MTQRTSDIHFPGTPGYPPNHVHVEVGKHADLPSLEPSWLAIHRSTADAEDRVVTFHTKEDFEAFLGNLLAAAEDAYDEPLDVDFPVGDGVDVIPVPRAVLDDWEARLATVLGLLNLIERARFDSTVVVNFAFDAEEFLAAVRSVEDALPPIEERHSLDDDPATPSEQQEAFRRVIEREVVLMRENEGASYEDELVPFAVNSAAADAIHRMAGEVLGQQGTRLDLFISEPS